MPDGWRLASTSYCLGWQDIQPKGYQSVNGKHDLALLACWCCPQKCTTGNLPRATRQAKGPPRVGLLYVHHMTTTLVKWVAHFKSVCMSTPAEKLTPVGNHPMRCIPPLWQIANLYWAKSHDAIWLLLVGNLPDPNVGWQVASLSWAKTRNDLCLFVRQPARP